MSNNNQILQAIFWALASSLFSAIMVNMVRHVSADLNVAVIIFFRNIFAFLIFVPLIYIKGVDFFKTSKIKLHCFRSLSGVIAMLAFFYGISKMNLSLVTAISFTAPLFMAVFAYLFLGDKFGKSRLLALLFGFLGTLVVIRPGFETFDPISLIVVFSAVFWAISGILIKKLSEADHPFSITLYMTIFMTAFTAPLMFFVWQEPSMDNLLWIFGIALTSNLLQFSLAKSLSLVDISVILPLDYTRLVFTAIIAYFVYEEVIDLPTAIGSLIIFFSGAFTVYREGKNKKTNKEKAGNIA